MKLLSFGAAIVVATLSTAVLAGSSPQSPSAADARVYIISPANGATVDSPVTISFGLSGMGVAPAGTDTANTGHHHLLVDGKALPVGGVPMGSQVKHFGGGQTETRITLAPGSHSLQLMLGDKNHVLHNPPLVSEKVMITVR